MEQNTEVKANQLYCHLEEVRTEINRAVTAAAELRVMRNMQEPQQDQEDIFHHGTFKEQAARIEEWERRVHLQETILDEREANIDEREDKLDEREQRFGDELDAKDKDIRALREELKRQMNDIKKLQQNRTELIESNNKLNKSVKEKESEIFENLRNLGGARKRIIKLDTDIRVLVEKVRELNKKNDTLMVKRNQAAHSEEVAHAKLREENAKLKRKVTYYKNRAINFQKLYKECADVNE